MITTIFIRSQGFGSFWKQEEENVRPIKPTEDLDKRRYHPHSVEDVSVLWLYQRILEEK